MSAIILCSTGADCLCYIDLDKFTLKKILYNLSNSQVGPHGIRSYENVILTANNYNDTVSIFDKESLKEIKSIRTGPKPNDILLIKDKILTICGESNSLEIYDLEEERKSIEIPTGSWPHSIEYLDSNEILFISNLEDHCITIISNESYEVIGRLETPEYPTKVRLSKDKKFLYVCESYLGSDLDGFLDIFSTNNLKRVNRVKVGAAPVDLADDDNYIYISNFTDGTITIVNKDSSKVEKTLYVGGMPKGIIKFDKYIYVSDYLKNRVIILENNKFKKVIAIEAEPNAMTIF